jgi:hypothetical protein
MDVITRAPATTLEYLRMEIGYLNDEKKSLKTK